MTSAVESVRAKGETLTPAASRTLGGSLGEGGPMAALRARAAAAAAVPGMPRRIERPWKYLDVEHLDLDAYRPACPATEAADQLRARLAPVGACSALALQHNSETLVAESRTKGVSIVDFAAASGRDRQRIEEHVGASVPFERNRFTAVHYAFLRGGLLVDVAANIEVEAPVRIVRQLDADGQLATPHTLIVTGANSHVTVVEDYRSSAADIIAIPAVEIVPGPGSQVRYIALHRWGRATRVFSEQRTVTARDAAVVGLSVVTGGQVVKGHIESTIAGRGSSSELYGLFLGDGDAHIDFYTVQDHVGADTRSDLLFKSALQGRSRAVYYGLTRVGLGAKNADANQENRNLLLSREAKADSDPVLEILTNNVIRVSHGVTAGPVDEEQLYYLQSRGLRRQDAESLLVRAFLGQVVDRQPSEALRDELAAVLEEKLEGRS